MVRNLKISKILLLYPGLFCRNRIGVPNVISTKSDIKINIGLNKTKTNSENRISSNLLITGTPFGNRKKFIFRFYNKFYQNGVKFNQMLIKILEA